MILRLKQTIKYFADNREEAKKKGPRRNRINLWKCSQS